MEFGNHNALDVSCAQTVSSQPPRTILGGLVYKKPEPTGTKSPAQAMQDAQKEADRLLRSYK